ncbi:MAG: hypothetical protein ACD_41C00329G0004 [uncultured bacterium]|nr:MAG: hypothetical protein ACD_41C00329G0004 [uncultured bacterium]
MNKAYQFNISGMTCHACETLITMDLTDAGFTPTAIDHATGIMTISLADDAIAHVKEIIQGSGTYRVTTVTPL